MKKRTKRILGLVLAAMAVPGQILRMKNDGTLAKGNRPQYDLMHTQKDRDPSLKGKKILFLGSSVTYGSAAKGTSFVDYLERRQEILPYKYALSGTTLVDEKVMGKPSYIERMKQIDPKIDADLFVCQLSTNDASLKKPLGEVSGSFDLEDLNTKTIAGAIEYIIAYVKKTWNCPILFYTGTKYDSPYYEKMIDLLYEIKEKWKIEVLDLWHDEEMNAVSKQDYALYMVNGIHPSKAGYRDWWTPKFEEKLKAIFEGNKNE
ncbi:MAG: SGNH/GDSL hydrolase family protein [Erysipelotrichaceae bacterium]|nr:SGNH/GDSL hydrolase family protein [Erysipelotrichaceae bacterium]